MGDESVEQVEPSLRPKDYPVLAAIRDNEEDDIFDSVPPAT